MGRHLRDISEGLCAKGIDVVLCSPALPDGLQAPVEHIPLDLVRAVSPRADLTALRRLARAVRELRPDVVHAHSSKAGAIARLARASSPHTPVLYTPHGYAFAGHFDHSGEQLAYRTAERLLAPLATRVVCVCEVEARLARSIGPAGRVEIIHNGIAPAGSVVPDARIASLARSGPVIGALTMLRPGKGMETLIAALPRVLAAHPGAQVAIVGDGPDLRDLEQSARALGVAEAVHFLGASSDPLAALSAMDIFVHPSWAESFPYVILEAMSLARPIVASDVGGVGEAVLDGESGLLVAPRDEVALADGLTALLGDPARAARLGELALARARELFTMDAMVDGLSQLYFDVARVDD